MASEDDKKRDSAMSDWMKVMLEEIERKESEQEEAREELRRRGLSPEGARGKDDASTDSHG